MSKLKIPAEAIEAVRAAIAPLDTEEARDAYRCGDFPRSDRVKDLDKRYRWDLFWAVRGHNIIANTVDNDVLFSEYLDSHIDSALRSIVDPL